MPRLYLNFIMFGINLILLSWTRRKFNQNINISNQFLASQCHNMYKIWHFLANWHLDSGHEKSKMYSLQQNQILLHTSVSCQLWKNKISIMSVNSVLLKCLLERHFSWRCFPRAPGCVCWCQGSRLLFKVEMAFCTAHLETSSCSAMSLWYFLCCSSLMLMSLVSRDSYLGIFALN